MQFRPDVGNGPGLALRRPGAPGPPFPAPPLRGGFPVDYGPRVDDRRYTSQAPSRPNAPKAQQQQQQQSDDQEEAPPSRHLWVGNVSQEVTEGQLVEKFSKYGPIESVTVYSQRNYAFINFKNLENAQDAKNGLQGVVLGGLAMRIEFAKGAKPSRHLWVGGIGSTVTRELIEGEFKRFGMMEDFKFLRDRNCAFVDYVKIEDAIAAVDSLNRKRLGDEELRVDFGRSQPPKRETRPGSAQGDDWGTPSRDVRGHSDQFRAPTESFRGPPDGFRDSERPSQLSGDSFRGSSEGFQAGVGTASNGPGSGRNRDKEEPSDVLWVGFPLLSKVDEEGLRRAFVPYGEVERVKTFPGRTYAFVQFKNVEEATRAKDALEGKLFNDPRVHIRFSNSEIGPVDNPRTDGTLVSPSGGREAPGFAEKSMVRIATTERYSATNPPMRPTGLRPEYYPGGLARGAALARAAAVAGSGLVTGRGAGRGLAPDGRMSLDERDYQTGGQGGRSARPGSRAPYDDGWDLPDEEIISREPKRMRVLHGGGAESAYNSNYDGGRRYAEADSFGPGSDSGNGYGGNQSRSTVAGDDYNQGSGVPRPRIGPLHFDPPRPAPAGQAQLHAGTPSGPVKRETFAPEVGVTGINEGWRWHGTIAKGGTPVCRARCLPVGKGIDVTVPDVVNCTARTDLDMLAKHVYQAGDFGVVFFVPEADPDVPPYHDFMHYLGEKHRAGVAKLADGTTLFLVPPSEFSERVLKVPGNNCLFGVVLKAPQPIPAAYVQPQPQPAPPQQLHPPQQLQSQSPQQQSITHPPQYSQSQGPPLSSGHSSQDNGSFQGPPPPQGQPPAQVAASSNLTQSHLNSLSGGLPTVLTPELIASLTALLPQQNQGPLPPTSAPPSMSTPNLLPPSANGVGSGAYLGRGGPSSGSATPAMPNPSNIDNRSNYRPAQGSQQSMVTSQGWPSSHSEQQSGGGGHLSASAEQGSLFTPSQQPQASLPVASNVQQPLPGAPTSQGQLGFSGSQSQGFSGPGFGGQQLPQQPRPPQHPPPQLGGTPQLPADQLAQLTALLTQRQQQPAQQQQAAQLLQQHYQQQQPTTHPILPQPPLPSHQPQTQNYTQQSTQPPQYSQQAPSQSQWGQASQLPQHTSQNLMHSQGSSVNSGGWEHGSIGQGQQHQSQQQPVPPQQPPQAPISQLQQQHASSGLIGADQGGSSNQDEAERQKRFQATLQLAAALLQQMQHQQTPGQGSGDQR
ncbi:hypothetical protein Mapa_008567 [Marchantia paleacea]|nr:hypothetical protein Mapa_008567 [Marchantia paleacea]